MREFSKRQSTLIRYLNCPEPMSRMMEKSHANRAEAARVDGGLAWLEACTKCIFCHRVEECRNWLEGSETRVTPRDFCGNSEFFRSCVD